MTTLKKKTVMDYPGVKSLSTKVRQFAKCETSPIYKDVGHRARGCTAQGRSSVAGKAVAGCMIAGKAFP